MKPLKGASAKAALTSASKPIPQVQKNGDLLARQQSILSIFPRAAISAARLMFIGKPNALAKPFPEPIGMIDKAVWVCSRPRATSLTVPSPPTAMTRAKPALAASSASSDACPA